MYSVDTVIGQHGTALKEIAPAKLEWPADGLASIPDWVYTSPEIYAREIERVFHGRSWNFVALEAEVANPGDFKRSYVGPTPVVVARDMDGSIHVVENRCAHRGVEFCRSLKGNAKEFVCPYHQWTYDLAGNLRAVPFRRGIKKEGGMPADFRLEEHGLRQLNVAVLHGVVFASYADDMESVEDYLGAEILRDFEAVFKGRRLRILGYYRNELPGNWKLYHENLKDPYHATLLHSFLVTFGLMVAGSKNGARPAPGRAGHPGPRPGRGAPGHGDPRRGRHRRAAAALGRAPGRDRRRARRRRPPGRGRPRLVHRGDRGAHAGGRRRHGRTHRRPRPPVRLRRQDGRGARRDGADVRACLSGIRWRRAASS
jgi:phenylpropionate dioxygenase-like ring-hydroxylating dioxygenase large terminal subunit